MNMRSMLGCRPAAVVTIVVSLLSAGAAVAVGPASAATSACSPVITSVSSFAAAQTQTVTITGSCLGTAASQTAADTPDLRITDLSAEPIWNGCHDGTGDNDSVGCTITSWTNTSITFAGYGGSYGEGNWFLSRGDDVAFMVWNPQTGAGPGFCRVTAGKPGTTACPASLPAAADLSTPAAHAADVTYTAQFKVPSAGLTGGTSQITVTAPAGTVLPGAISEAYDATVGADLGGWGGGAASRGGATMTWTAGASVPARDVLVLTIPGVTNPAAGSDKLGVATTGPASSVQLPFTVTARHSVGSVAVAPRQPAVAGASTQYTVQFTASPTGGLMVDQGQLTLTAPAGTVLPSTIADVYDVTSGQDLGSWGGGSLSASGAQGTWSARSGVLAGDVVDLTLNSVTDPAAGSYQLAVSTSSDGAAKTASYVILDPAKVPEVSGVVSYDNGGTSAPVSGSIVQACDGGTCVTAQAPTDSNGNYSMFVPAAGSYTVTAFAPTSNAYAVGEGSAGPVSVAIGRSTVNVTLPPLAPLPSGVSFNGQPAGTVANVFWGSPAPVSVSGCEGGAAVSTVTSIDSQTGEATVMFGPLTETPAGSGTYTGTIPALYPSHGTGADNTAIECFTPSALLPSAGPSAGGTQVQINGTGLLGATAVKFGGARAESFTVASDSQIDAVAPPGSGTVAVDVVTPGGTVSSPSLSQYTYLTVGSVSPASGPTAGGTTVTITGSGLSDVAAVYFGGAAATNVTIDSSTTITATTPAGTGVVAVSVMTADGGQSAASGPVFSYGAGAAGAVAGAVPVRLSAASTTSASTASASRPASVSRLAAAGGGGDEGGLVGTFVEWGTDKVVESQEDRILATTATSCIRGYSFTQSLQQAITQYEADFNQTVTWSNIKNLASQTYGKLLSQLQRLSSGGTGTAISTDVFLEALASFGKDFGESLKNKLDVLKCFVDDVPLLINQAKALVFSFRIDPSGTVVNTNGASISGATVTLLQSASKLGPFSAPPTGSPIMDPSVNPETTGANGVFHWDAFAGYYKVTATKAGCWQPGHPAQPAVATGVFAIPPPKVGIVLVLQCKGEKPPARPAVTGLSATSGPAVGGAQLDVLGSGFKSGSVVRFGKAKATVDAVLSPADILVTAPPGSGTVAVTVTTAGKTSALSVRDRYTYIAAARVTRVSPAHGPAKGGTIVKLTGAGFAAGDQVAFGAAPAESVAVVSATTILAAAPVGAGTVAVTVRNVDGPSKASAADDFSYAGRPVISSASSFTATRGKKASFTVRAGGYPVPVISESGRLPAGLAFRAHSGGTATITGTPAKAGRYTITIKARNRYGTVTQVLTIVIRA